MKRKLYPLFIYILLLISSVNAQYPNLPSFEPDANIDRSEIPDIFKWNLRDLCESIEKWEEGIAQCQKDLNKIESGRKCRYINT